MEIVQASAKPTPTKTTRHAPWKWTGIVALVLLVGAGVAGRLVIARAQPILRTRVIETLSNRFNSKVELANLNVSVVNGIEVSGNGLKIFGTTDPNPYEPGIQALIGVQEFRFQTSLLSLFRSPMHVETVYVKGLELNIPPKGDRREMANMGSKTPKMTIFVDRFVCQDTRLMINTSKPGKPPLEFAIDNLRMKDIGPGQPLQFDATLVNPKPVGDIQSTGLFGPWQQDSPRDTPVQGDYSFTHADLSTIKGIGGMLSSTGEYSGTLGNIVVHGETDTPDFRIASSGHAVPLHTEFHAVVDGTSGDTYLQPVNATFLHSSLTANGSVVRVSAPKGHDIELDVVLDKARIEDLLQLGVRTDPPVMSGPVEMNTRLSLAPGDANVADRLKLAGSFHVLRGHFANQKVQGNVDSLSLRSLGKPKEAQEHSEEDVPVDLRGVFTLKDGVLSFSLLHFLIPGTHVDMTGDYSLDGQTFDFHGEARLDAKLSQMTTGWKSILLKPVDPFFSKNGAGTEVPIRISGTESEPHFGLDFGHKDEHENVGKNADTGPKPE
ncbi:MAG: AsmA-like C-terminal region-containing protein [Candidatus Sulfotelmatobacter sp.]